MIEITLTNYEWKDEVKVSVSCKNHSKSYDRKYVEKCIEIKIILKTKFTKLKTKIINYNKIKHAIKVEFEFSMFETKFIVWIFKWFYNWTMVINLIIYITMFIINKSKNI